MHQAERHPGLFWQPGTLEELAAKQKIKPIQQSDEVVGRGADLWATDEEMEQFLAAIQDHRHDTANA